MSVGVFSFLTFFAQVLNAVASDETHKRIWTDLIPLFSFRTYAAACLPDCLELIKDGAE